MEIGRYLNFDDHVTSQCKKARLYKFMSFTQKRILMKTFVESHFGYWMFHSMKLIVK